MSKNKIVLSLAVAGILGASNVLAETSTGFVGLQGNTGFGGHTQKVENKIGNSKNSQKTKTSFYQFGFLAGYKHFFVPKFGLRFYGLLDYANDEVTGTKNSNLTFSLNTDALFNFISNENFDLGGFGGLSIGYATREIELGSSSTTLDGIDFGLNVGLRANIAQHHSLELYTRIGLIGQKDEYNAGTTTITNTGVATITTNTSGIRTTRNKQDYIGGLRYTYSF